MNPMPSIRSICLAIGACLLYCAVAVADPPVVHRLNGGVLVPGATGEAQLQRGGPLPGYYQPLEIRGPKGSEISVVVDNQFTVPEASPLKAAMLIGPVYRLRVTDIPLRPGDEVYPTIEVINRLYPSCGEELRFPIPIELTQEDLAAAIEGKFVTRIVYLENPCAAYARPEDPKSQYTLELNPKEDPLAVADRLGRPMAIVRIGGRVPLDGETPDEEFMYHSPPLLRFAKASGVQPMATANDLPSDRSSHSIFQPPPQPEAPLDESEPEAMVGPRLTR